jgi:serine protease
MKLTKRSRTCAVGLTSAASLVLFGLAAGAASAAVAQTGNTPNNPYSPEFGHSYCHGAVPTLSQLTQMRNWDKAHPSAAPATAVGTTANKTLYFQGGQSIGGQAAQAVVSSKPRVYLVFWGSQWGTQSTDANGNLAFSGDYDKGAAAAQGLFKGLGTGGEQWSGTMTQYCDGSTVAVNATSCPAGAPHIGYPTGGALAGVWYDNAAAEPASATGTQIGNEAVAAATHFGNTTVASNRYAQYMILSAPGSNPDNYKSGNAGCAWHSDAPSGSIQIPFTNQPYNMDTNFCGAGFVNSPGTLDGYTITLGHEYAETITDEYPDSGWFNTTAAGGEGENGDDCAWISSGQGAAGNVAMSTGSFAMQSTWSNDTNECDLSHVTVGSGANTVTVTNPGNQADTVGTAASLTVHATDSAGATLSYNASGLPVGLAINASTGVISGTPTAAATS